MRKSPERRQEEERLKTALRSYFVDSYRQVEFFYSRKMRAMLVTYLDFKQEHLVKPEVMEVVGEGWNVILKREFSDLTVMLTMLKLFKENRVAIVEEVGGELYPYTVREYVHRLMAKQ